MRLLKIGCDVDGVFARFNESFAQTLTKTSGRTLTNTPEPFPVWNWMALAGYTNPEISAALKAVDADPLWWTKLQTYPGASVALAQLAGHVTQLRASVHFLTTRPSPSAHWQTTYWLSGVCIPPLVPQVCICQNAESKGSIAAGLGLDLFVDDNVDNIYAVRRASPTTVCLLFDQPWNRPASVREVLGGLGVRVIDSLPQLLHYVEYLLHELNTIKETE